MATPQKTLTPEEFQKVFGDALAAPMGNPSAPREYPVPDARKRGRGRGKGLSDVADETFQPIDFGAPPPSRAVGGVRGKFEREDEFDYRMNQAIPRGARRGGAVSSLDQQMLMDEGMGAEEARIKSNIIRSRGGMLGRDKEGKLGQQSATARRAPISSTGRAYDPVTERKAILTNAKAAVDERKNLQESDAILLRKQQEAINKVGSTRGFANQYGSGQGTTVLKSAPRPEATVTLGRNNPYTLPMREEIGFMENDMKAEADFLKRKQSRK